MHRALFAHPWYTLSVMTLVVLGVAHRAFFIQQDNSPDTFFAADRQARQTYHEMVDTFGGDEYVVACPDLDLAATTEVAQAIHAAVNAHEFEREGVTLRPGISIGVTCFPEHAHDPLALFSCGDRALYGAKRGGRNRVCVYDP